jgi:hypothetical protein
MERPSLPPIHRRDAQLQHGPHDTQLEYASWQATATVGGKEHSG